MKYSTDQVINGLIAYADSEIMGKLPTTGQWVMGTALGLASNKVGSALDVLKGNTIVQMLGIIDEDGMVDVDALTDAMKKSADKYGKITVDIPLVGRLSFSSTDVENLKRYI